MQGVSRESLATARDRLIDALTGSDADPLALAGELFVAVGLLDEQPTLRRALTDPAASAARKAGLVRMLFQSRLTDTAVDVLSDLAGARWAAPRDLADTAEELAVQCAVVGADRAAQLDDLEDELFRFGRIVAANPDLRGALVDPVAPDASKAELVRRLLADRAKPATLLLVEQIATRPRSRSIEGALDHYAQLAAFLRRRLLAYVRVAVALTEAERDRLTGALRRLYGRDMHLNVEVDPDVVGGMAIQIGHEVIDGTVITRLEQARSRLAG
ncbi:MAG: F0F1 ATP synthase subunit delta [Actinomycetes bacterium]|jgi:F-type H+-transporting ATPase subunit delta